MCLVVTYAVFSANFQAALKPLVRAAWAESPSLAIELVSRFNMSSVHQEVRWLLLNFPTKALNDAEALSILFGGELPPDVGFQLKVCHVALNHNVNTNRLSISCTGRR